MPQQVMDELPVGMVEVRLEIFLWGGGVLIRGLKHNPHIQLNASTSFWALKTPEYNAHSRAIMAPALFEGW